ncbi:MAG TPA: hypothetical protein PLO37_05950 [Candidatus Hydrogenedentes bacterium]|nr:hypothetical protein [Candidatus Hydrogenedentota bacterium]HPG66372.1 hypothetical protein [Candidatus Hydrogenedentota bacterium]
MRKETLAKVICWCAVTMLMIALPGMAQDPGGPRRGGRWMEMDANRDGTITLGEAQAANPDLTEEQFKARDVNGDGVWDEADRPEDGPGMFRPSPEALDANQDGTVTREEYDAAWAAVLDARFKQLDANSDGVLSQEELAKEKRPQFEPRGGRPDRGGFRSEGPGAEPPAPPEM